ncbi:hypothetical protein B9L21_10050 [Geobacillus uzenensis]|uniref:Uncharacterized protein n=1 Tax=Geobacillus uzenensis TaxID=129339 RepID=A0ABX4DGY9_9BACL|nr:hypothetical protein B9L21_10050 [Geobacillus uzenensis]
MFPPLRVFISIVRNKTEKNDCRRPETEYIAHFSRQGYSPIFSPRHKMGKETEQFANKEGERTT